MERGIMKKEENNKMVVNDHNLVRKLEKSFLNLKQMLSSIKYAKGGHAF